MRCRGLCSTHYFRRLRRIKRGDAEPFQPAPPPDLCGFCEKHMDTVAEWSPVDRPMVKLRMHPACRLRLTEALAAL